MANYAQPVTLRPSQHKLGRFATRTAEGGFRISDTNDITGLVRFRNEPLLKIRTPKRFAVKDPYSFAGKLAGDA